MKPIASQPEFIDCQQELLRLRVGESAQVAAARNWALIGWAAALGGWITVGVMIAIR